MSIRDRIAAFNALSQKKEEERPIPVQPKRVRPKLPFRVETEAVLQRPPAPEPEPIPTPDSNPHPHPVVTRPPSSDDLISFPAAPPVQKSATSAPLPVPSSRGHQRTMTLDGIPALPSPACDSKPKVERSTQGGHSSRHVRSATVFFEAIGHAPKNPASSSLSPAVQEALHAASLRAQEQVSARHIRGAQSHVPTPSPDAASSTRATTEGEPEASEPVATRCSRAPPKPTPPVPGPDGRISHEAQMQFSRANQSWAEHTAYTKIANRALGKQRPELGPNDRIENLYLDLADGVLLGRLASALFHSDHAGIGTVDIPGFEDRLFKPREIFQRCDNIGAVMRYLQATQGIRSVADPAEIESGNEQAVLVLIRTIFKKAGIDIDWRKLDQAAPRNIRFCRQHARRGGSNQTVDDMQMTHYQSGHIMEAILTSATDELPMEQRYHPVPQEAEPVVRWNNILQFGEAFLDVAPLLTPEDILTPSPHHSNTECEHDTVAPAMQPLFDLYVNQLVNALDQLRPTDVRGLQIVPHMDCVGGDGLVGSNEPQKIWTSLSFNLVDFDTTNEASVTIPADIVLILDQSGSMQVDDKMTHMKDVVRRLILETLKPEDQLSIIGYSHNVTTLQGLTPMTPEGRIASLDRLESLEPQDQTFLSGALYRGVQMLQQQRLALSAKPRNSAKGLLLMTDGEANIGDTEVETIVTRIRTQFGQGLDDFPVHTIGFGDDCQHSFLAELAAKLKGVYSFGATQSMEHLEKAFILPVLQSQKTVASSLTLTLTAASPHLTFTSIERPYQILSQSPQTIQIDLPNLIAENPQFNICVQVQCVPSQWPPGQPLYHACLRYQNRVQGVDQPPEELRCTLHYQVPTGNTSQDMVHALYRREWVQILREASTALMDPEIGQICALSLMEEFQGRMRRDEKSAGSAFMQQLDGCVHQAKQCLEKTEAQAILLSMAASHYEQRQGVYVDMYAC